MTPFLQLVFASEREREEAEGEKEELSEISSIGSSDWMGTGCEGMSVDVRPKIDGCGDMMSVCVCVVEDTTVGIGGNWHLEDRDAFSCGVGGSGWRYVCWA
jgi:hypothetical protein